MASKKGKLTNQEELFCLEYIVDLNGTKAAQRTGFSRDNPDSAAVTAHRLLSKDKIQNRIQELFNRRAAKIEISSDTVLRELLKIATVDISQAYDSAGWLKRLDDIPEEVRRSISGIETQEMFSGDGDDKQIIGMNRKVRFYDKTKALEMLGKHLKLFTDKHEHSGPDGKPIEHKDVSEISNDQLDLRLKELLEKAGKSNG